MQLPFISDRSALDDAVGLMSRFGDDAGYEAALRAEQSRAAENVARFCHWRQIERVIAVLSSTEIAGPIH